ncbi:MAG: hypothetical protein M1820_006873 [Bogoriella megaspora]|nr:MAG: hypothetical protein M1820_006873 [Bogoriella megaspora]
MDLSSPSSSSDLEATIAADDPISVHYPSTCEFCTIASSFPPPTVVNPRTITNPTTTSNALPFQNHTLLSTPDVLAFLDINPINTGHLLLIPRSHTAHIDTLPPSISSTLGWWLPILSRALRKATGVEDWNIQQNNGVRAKQTIYHVHFHFVPRPEVPLGKSSEAREWARWAGHEARAQLDEEEGEELARKMRRELRRELEGIRKAEERL